MLTDHLRNSPRDPDGNAKPTARSEAMRDQQAKLEQLQASGKYTNKIIYPGFEWDMMGLDHASVAIVDSNSDAVPVEAIHQFEWLYSYDTNKDQFHSNEEKLWGPRLTKDELKLNKDKTFEAIEWLKNNYPESFVLPNHPSRHNGSDTGVVTIEDLRKMNDIAPNIVFGMEGMPGGQMSPDGHRADMTDIYGGADVMIAQVGGIWDALLGEGRRFWNFTNSDHHFKISSNRKYSSGYWPSEYSRNYTWVEGDSFKDVVDGMRSGKSFAVYGDLIDALDFTASGNDEKAEMGEELQVAEGENTTISIRFKSPEYNNYAPIGEHASTVTNEVEVNHIDLISGEVTGKLDESEYGDTTNETTKVVKRFTEADWGEPDADGYYTITYTVPADTDRYYRLRGTNLDENVEGYIQDGEPLQDQSFADVVDNEERFNKLNDRNYTGLWFYSNPIFVDVMETEKPSVPSVNFTDVGNHWAAASIDFVTDKELFVGTSSTTFSPNNEMTRGMLITVLHRLAGKPAGDDSISFNDVATDAYYHDAVKWASSNGIVKGIGDNQFAPQQSITREQLALIFFNFAQTLKLDVNAKQSLSSFTDNNRVSHWAVEAMQWATGSKLLVGNGNNILNPTGTATRAEVASIVERMARSIEQ
jgi:S-layer homology domain